MMPQEDWNELPQRHHQLPTVPSTTWAKQMREIVIQRWQPVPLQVPMVDIDLPYLSAIERSAEVLRYTCSRLEYWLSPQGMLREWLRFNLRIACVLVVPALVVAPLVTLALGQFRAWVDLIVSTTSNLVLFPLSALLVIGLISGLISIGRSIMIMRIRQQQRRDPYG